MEELNRRRDGALSRMVFKALGLFGGTQVVTILCGIVRVKIIAVVLGTAGVGLFSIFNSALTLVSGLTQLNLRTSAIRTLASRLDSPSFPSTVFMVRRLALWLGLLGVAVMLLSAPIFSWRTFGNFSQLPSFMLLAVAVFMMAVTTTDQAVMQAMRLYRPLASCTVRGAIAGLLLTLPLVWFLRMDCVIWVIIGYAFSGWIFVRRLRPRIPLVEKAPSAREVWSDGRPLLMMGFYLTLASATAELCSYIFIAWLNNAGGIGQVGLFQSGYTLVHRYMGMIFSAIGMEFFPRLSTVASSGRRTSLFVSHEMLLLTVVMLGVVSAFIPLAPIGVRIVYSSEFLDIVPFVILSMPGVIVQGVSWCMAFVILSRGDGRLYMFTEVFSALLMITLNIVSYHLWGLWGVGLSFSVYYLIYTAVIGWIYFRRYRLYVSRLSMLVTGIVFLVVTVMSMVALLFHPLWALVIALPSVVVSAILVRRMYRRH